MRVDALLKEQNLQVTNGVFIRDEYAYIFGINLICSGDANIEENKVNKFIPIVDTGSVIWNVLEHYKLRYSAIITAECNLIYKKIRKEDPDNIYPIKHIISDDNRIIGIKFGDKLKNKAVCDLKIINIILKKLKRPTIIEEDDCKCILF